MTKEYGGPVMYQPVTKNPGAYLTAGELADVILHDHEDKAAVADRLRWYFKQGYLTPAARETEGRKSWLFQPEEALVADALTRLHRFVGNNDRAARAVMLALSGWRVGDRPEGMEAEFEATPARHVIAEYVAGHRDWNLEVWAFYRPDNADLHFEARIMTLAKREGTTLGFTSNKNYVVESVWAIELTPALDRFYPKVQAIFDKRAMH
ncbi:hypothetical protein [Wenxinia marina]|uniref:Uncharacterized protein n=1 Tax=Wenxinia marina DSM 24838 TaxID=1123501 RepID=A0A0D0QDW0_9RHOB|nr:hypothetical protein [Wenxinia marina]KIQ70557.1 hypothetical protein Wenmar_00934 [Wenxinia marina DSM 24838]GGL52174.1 hypothetical protein GCM10011392_03150 [Wenxinia marina]